MLPQINDMRRDLDYDPDTGVFTIKRHSQPHLIGRETLFSTDAHGHKAGKYRGYRIRAHRAAWAMHYGVWPNGDLDHIDGDAGNNRISNLRECEHRQNMCNRRSAQGSSSRFLGVYLHKGSGKWRAEIRKNGVSHKLGTFADEALAAAAYDRAAKSLHGEFARLNFK